MHVQCRQALLPCNEMLRDKPLWILESTTERGQALLLHAAERCRGHLCEECVLLLEQIALLDPQNSEVQYQLGICYGGGCREHSLTNADVAVEQLRRALALLGWAGDPAMRARILNGRGNAFMQSRRLAVGTRLSAAIQCYERAASFWLKQGDRARWAMAEFNLGNACCELPCEDVPDKWQQAISHYENALDVRTRQRDPLHHAATLENLGTAYRELSIGDKARNVRKAIDCYRQALRVYTAAAFPLQNAALHNNLGNAYLTLPPGNPAGLRRNVQRALRHFDQALRVRWKSQQRSDYAGCQFNRRMAFLRPATAVADPLQPVRKARACFEEAKECFSSCGRVELADRAQERLDPICAHLRAA